MKKLPKKQRGGYIGDGSIGDTTTGQISQTRDATNNDVMKYFNDLEASRNRRDPGMQGDRVPLIDPIRPNPTGNTEIRENTTTDDSGIKYPEGRKVPVRFKKGGSWEGIGEKKLKKPKYKKNKKAKPNKKGLF